MQAPLHTRRRADFECGVLVVGDGPARLVIQEVHVTVEVLAS